jgi:hypothetical protein
MNPIKTVAAAVAIMLVTALTAVAQQPPAPCGAPMSLDAAKIKAIVAPNYSATLPSLRYPCSRPHVSSSQAGIVGQQYAR